MVGWDRMAAGMDDDVDSWNGQSGSTLRCRMVLPEVWYESVELECGWRCVLVAGFQRGALKPGMTDFFHVGELIPGPPWTNVLNDFMSASAAHRTVTNTWMNTHTELEFPTVPVVWFNTALCEDVDKTIVQKLWVIEQMDCGRDGLVQDDAEARLKAGESLEDLMAPMTSTVVSMAASWAAPMEASMVAPMASMASMASMVEALD